MPFRETHHVAGAAVRHAEKENTSLAGLSKAQLATLHPAFENDSDADVAALWDFDRSSGSRDAQGGPPSERKQVAAEIGGSPARRNTTVLPRAGES